VWHSNKSVAANVRAGAASKAKSSPVKSRQSAGGVSAIVGARVAKLPASLSPMLATLVDAIPTSDEWLHEIKFDGYRMLCRIDKGKVTVFSRNGKEWTAAGNRSAAAAGNTRQEAEWV